MKTTKRLTLLALVVLSGLAPVGVTADSDTLFTMCFRGRTIQVPAYLVPRYQAYGATPGPCL